MGRKGITDNFWESAYLNNATYIQYYDMLTELAVSMFEWKGLPDTVDPRYIEMQLFYTGSVLYFKDDVMNEEYCLNMLTNGAFNMYGEPVQRRAYSTYNNYQYVTNDRESVIIWNNYLRKNSVLDVKMFARRLYNLDRIIDVNANAQKTPVLVQGSVQQRLTLLNLYKEFEGNAPVIFGDKNLDLNSLKVLQTQAPFVADKIYQLKMNTLNDALTRLGISNVNFQKRERMVTSEVDSGNGVVDANRYTRSVPRNESAVKINNMFGRDVRAVYREGFEEQVNSVVETVMSGGVE